MERNQANLWALLLIGIGVVLLLRNTDVLPSEVGVWPLVAIGLGVWLLVHRLFLGRGADDGFVWAVLLIGVGVVFLLRDLDVIDSDVTLWPVILIAIGLGIVLSAIPSRRSSTGEVRRSVPLDGAARARVRIKHGAGRLSVRSASDPGVLLDGAFGAEVEPRVHRRGDEVEVVVEGRWRGPWDWGHRAFDWSIGLARGVPLTLSVDAGANQAELDLAELAVTQLRVNTGASETSIVMPASGSTDASVTCGAAKVAVRIPERTAARIVVRAGLMGVNVDETRFPKSADGYRSPDFDTATDRVDLRVEGGAASLEIR